VWRVNPLRACLTVEQCWQRTPGGSGVYVVELTRALAARDDVTVTGVAARHRSATPSGAAPAGRTRFSRLPRRALYDAWDRLRRPRAEALAGPTDVVHATTWAIPGRRAPLVVTVHDLAFLRDPAHFTSRGNRFFRRNLVIARDEAAMVVVPSEATRADCVDVGIDPARIVVVPHGVRALEVDVAARTRWAQEHGVRRPYVLWCGTLEPRKNLARLVEAYRRLISLGGPAVDLVLAGPVGWGGVDAHLRDALAALPDGSVHLLGRLSYQELQVAYAGAAAFAFPSTWEGFGMPVLEAMAHGVPVVTSAGTSMAEFAAGAGALVDPADPDAIAEGLARVLGDEGELLGAAGRERAAGMTWARSAEAHVMAYRSALGGRQGEA
jgi:glycosyltransferase involved in cell wall biosynthesis